MAFFPFAFPDIQILRSLLAFLLLNVNYLKRDLIFLKYISEIIFDMQVWELIILFINLTIFYILKSMINAMDI